MQFQEPNILPSDTVDVVLKLLSHKNRVSEKGIEVNIFDLREKMIDEWGSLYCKKRCII
jgi:hypothetical protein